ncbi:hypothetical protein M404DRAFT_939363, partial [Pisolithus tinctorius Marx 270]
MRTSMKTGDILMLTCLLIEICSCSFEAAASGIRYPGSGIPSYNQTVKLLVRRSVACMKKLIQHKEP